MKLEKLDLEKKTIVDTIKIAAYNAEAWLLERLEHHYDNPYDICQMLQVFAQLKGQTRALQSSAHRGPDTP